MTFHWSFLLGPIFSPFDRQQLSIAESLLKNAEFSRQVNMGRDHQFAQIIATSHDLGPKKLRKGNPLISGKSFKIVKIIQNIGGGISFFLNLHFYVGEDFQFDDPIFRIG